MSVVGVGEQDSLNSTTQIKRHQAVIISIRNIPSLFHRRLLKAAEFEVVVLLSADSKYVDKKMI